MFDIVQVAFEAAVQVSRQQSLQVFPVGQQLAAGQFGDGQWVGQVQLKENIGAVVESLLGAVGDEVPYSSVGHVDGTE